ncbi:hypothetical protein AVEN_120256-1, partial [Araneus ventricosus]
ISREKILAPLTPVIIAANRNPVEVISTVTAEESVQNLLVKKEEADVFRRT